MSEPPVGCASVGRFAVRGTWLRGVLPADSNDDHRGRSSSTVIERTARPYILVPRPTRGGGMGARLHFAGDDAREVIRQELADFDAKPKQEALYSRCSIPETSMSPTVAAH
jgi:hypothetical protein